MEQVIDTNIWVKALDGQDEVAFDCLRALMKYFESQDLLALDYDGRIMSEYRRNVGSSAKFQICIRRLEQNHRTVYRSSDIPKKYDNRLYALGFQEKEDHIFVGVAMHADKRIITEDSDYGIHGEPDHTAAFDFMKNKMGLTVQNAKEYLAEG